MSAQKVSQTPLVTSLVMLAIGLVVLFAWQAAVAQCGDPKPSCVTCHAEVQPVFTQGEWHIIHARTDCCRNCHGGNDQTMDKVLAHVGLMPTPLNDIYLSCHQCHPDDYQQRAERFAAALGMTPKSGTPILALAGSASITVVVAIQPPRGELVIQPPVTKLPSNSPDSAPWLGAMIGIVMALLAGLALMWRKLSRGYR